MGERPGLVPETQDDFQRLPRHGPDVGRSDAEHRLVGGDRAGGHSEVQPASGKMIQHHQAAGEGGGVVHRQEEAARTQADVAGLGEGADQQEVGRGIGLPRHGVVLADPGLAIAKLIQPADDLQVPVEALLQIPLGRMGRHGEEAELHGVSCS